MPNPSTAPAVPEKVTLKVKSDITSPVPAVSFSSNTSAGSDRDRYGFRKASEFVTQKAYDEWDQEYSTYLHRRRRKWDALMRSHGLPVDKPTVLDMLSTSSGLDRPPICSVAEPVDSSPPAWSAEVGMIENGWFSHGRRGLSVGK